MAGIGFRLRALSEQDNLVASAASLGHSSMIAAGPWLFTVTALGLISIYSAEPAPNQLIDGFRLIVIYAFAVSLVLSAPIVLISTRLVGDALYLREFGRLRGLFLAAAMITACFTMAVGLVGYGFLLRLPPATAVAATSCCTLVALIWVALAFCSAVRDYQGITLGFLVGLGVAVPATVTASNWTADWVMMVWAFDAGLLIVLATLTSRVLATFQCPATDLVLAASELCAALAREYKLALAGFLGAVALWVDKWVMWTGPDGIAHELGLVHAPLYDSAMFTAYLTLIPALSLFVTHVETSFFTCYRAYYTAIQNHATLRQIDRCAEELKQVTFRTIGQIALIQGALCLVVVLYAPMIVSASGLFFQQVGIFRLGAVGGVFQFLFFAATSLLLFFGRYERFLALQAVFLALLAVLTLTSLQMGPAYYGLGYLAACVIAAVAALAVLERTIDDLNFVTFILANRPRSASRLLAFRSISKPTPKVMSPSKGAR